MRIIGGLAGGRILRVVKGLGVRPTPDLVRQAVFNSLGTRVEGTVVLELFGGTGALSLECLSRGARRAVCVELSSRHARMIRENLERCGFPEQNLELRVQDVFQAISQLVESKWQFDLILADPPFGEKNVGRRSESLAQRLLDHPEMPALLLTGGWFVLGHARRDTLSLPPHWMEQKVLRHGDSVMRFLALKAAP